MRLYKETFEYFGTLCEETKHEPCRTCPLVALEDIERKGPNGVSPAGEANPTLMWRHDWSKGESVDEHGYRSHISNWVGVSLEEAELIWNCGVS